MTGRHTPGPWVHDPELPFNAYSDDATGSIVATCEGFEYAPRPDAEKEANARLIAAAPDLLAALKQCLIFSEVKYGPIGDQVTAAIAKAEGTL